MDTAKGNPIPVATTENHQSRNGMNQEDLQFYGHYAPLLEQTETMLCQQLQWILARIPQEDAASPAEHICSRIKSASSVQGKSKKRGHSPTAQQALTHLSDLIGVRAVTHFVGDVYTILDQMQRDPTWEILRVKDYIADPKKNGYRSLHIILCMPFPDEQFQTIRAEIPLRTIAMDCWAGLEHQMKYKKDIPDADLISAELLRRADEMASTDLTMQTIREMIQGRRTEEGWNTL